MDRLFDIILTDLRTTCAYFTHWEWKTSGALL